MKLVLLFVIIAYMLCLHPHHNFIIGLFPSCDPLTHEYQYNVEGESAYYISWTGAEPIAILG